MRGKNGIFSKFHTLVVWFIINSYCVFWKQNCFVIYIYCFFTTCASSLERFFKNTLWLTSCVICSFFHELWSEFFMHTFFVMSFCTWVVRFIVFFMTCIVNFENVKTVFEIQNFTHVIYSGVYDVHWNNIFSNSYFFLIRKGENFYLNFFFLSVGCVVSSFMSCIMYFQT